MNKKILYNLLVLLLICIAGFILCYKAIVCGTIYGDDADVHTLWAQQFVKSFNGGNIYPRWVPDVNSRYGSPAFSFYPPVIFYTYVAFDIIFQEIPTMILGSVVAGMILSGIFMYLYSGLFFVKRAALIVSVIYMIVPYHLADLYFRSTVSEFWAFVWFPLVFYYAHKMTDERNAFSGIGLALSYAALLLTHPPSALVFGPFILAYFLFLSARHGNYNLIKRGMIFIIAGTVLGSFYLMPLLSEHKYIYRDYSSWFYYANNFLFSSEAGNRELNDFLSKSALTYLPVFVAALLLIRKSSDQLGGVAFFSSVAGIAAYSMMMRYSMPLWEFIPILQKLQFPWRLLSVASFFVSLCFGFLINQKYRGRSLIYILLFSLMVYNIVILIRYEQVNISRRDIDIRKIERTSFNLRAEMSYDELQGHFYRFQELINPIHLNSWLLDHLFIYSKRKVVFSSEAIEHAPGEFEQLPDRLVITPNPEVAFWGNGDGEIRVDLWQPEERSLLVSTGGGTLILRTFYYPHWKIYLDGSPAAMRSTLPEGLISVEIPPGSQNIRMIYEEGIWFKLGVAISCFTLLILASSYIIQRRNAALLPLQTCYPMSTAGLNDHEKRVSS